MIRNFLAAAKRLVSPSSTARTATATKAAPEVQVKQAFEALRSVKPSSNVDPKIVEALKTPLPQLQKLPIPELRKLAHHAFYGIGTPQDIDKATEIWVCASMQGCMESTYSVAMCLLEGKGCIDKDEAHGRQLLERLAESQHGWACFALATLIARDHNHPQGDPAQMKEAFRLYKVAAEQNVAPACKNVSNFLELGIGVEKNEREALKWLMKAAEAGDPTAQIVLGRKLTVGEGVEQDEEKGFALFAMAAETGRPAGLYNVGCAYFAGKGVKRDVTKAAEHFRLAAEAGFFPAQVNLANMYVQGLGVTPSLREGLKWYKLAGEQFPDRVEALIQYLEERIEAGEDDSAGAIPEGALGVGEVPTRDVMVDAVVEPDDASEDGVLQGPLSAIAAKGERVVSVRAGKAVGAEPSERSSGSSSGGSGGGTAPGGAGTSRSSFRPFCAVRSTPFRSLNVPDGPTAFSCSLSSSFSLGAYADGRIVE